MEKDLKLFGKFITKFDFSKLFVKGEGQLFNKMERTIQSCKTTEQLKIAEKYAILSFNHYSKLMVLSSFREKYRLRCENWFKDAMKWFIWTKQYEIRISG